MSPELHHAIARATAQGPRDEPPRWTVCVKNGPHQILVRLVLSSHRQVATLALELERIGFTSDPDDPDPCDFVFKAAHALA